ncbi:MAG: 4-hydroxybenzoate octaprenyltransferase [Pseudomonadales bacterium]|jgi:4-hydroxybenzoate polyprenyltransferase
MSLLIPNAVRAFKQFSASVTSRFPKLPYLFVIARLNKPIGIYLLLWPTLWALWIAAEGFAGWHLLTVFILGTILTRSAGCVINDIADRNFDGQVERTKGRPLVMGNLNVLDAFIFLAVLAFFALLLVLSTNILTVMIAFLGALIATIYPFMKRYTYLPQVILGIAFSCGIPMAFSATLGEVPKIAWLIMVANLVWTVAYDTQYAMVDREDDLRLGLKSSAILFADMDKIAIACLQVMFLLTLLLIGRNEQLSWPFYLGFSGAVALLIYQQYLIKDRSRDLCFKAFLNNHWVGLSIFSGLLGHYWLI